MKIKAQELTAAAFEPYGSYMNIHDGFSDDVISFRPDRLVQCIGAPALDSLCTIRIQPRPYTLTVTEYHEHCEEVFGGYDCEMLFHVGLLGDDGKPDLNTIRVFRMPAGTFCRVKRYVLHHAPFVCGNESADGIVLLPPATYTIDCKVLSYDTPIEIVF